MSDLDITDSVLAELRSAADIVEVIGEHTRLKKAGRSWKGLCPFHNERTPSLTVDREKGLYHCFGCGAGGDVIHFVRQIDRLDFPEAIESLAARFGISIPKRARGPRDDRRERLLEGVSAAHRFYAAELAKPGNRSAEYLASRGVAESLWRRLALGHAPDSWDALSRALSGAFPEPLLVEAGLLQPRQEGKGAYDRFRDRLLFVVKDDRGRPVGFGGRALSPAAEPKYLNSPESPLFQKKRLLYGLSDARDAMRRKERVVLVEGYFDHLALVEAGIEETVASMGTALTSEQAEKLHRLTPRIVLCYDGDAAGRSATSAALQHVLAQGCVATVAKLPRGSDPHDVLRQEGPAALAARIEGAPDYLTWLLEDAPLEDPEITSSQKTERISRILEIVAQIPDTIFRHEECRRVARRAAVPLDLLWERVKPKGEARAAAKTPGAAGTPRHPSVLMKREVPAAERRLVQCLITAAEYNPLILRALRDAHLTDPMIRRIVEALRRSGGASETIDFQQQIAHLSEEERIFISEIALEEHPAPTREGVDGLLKDLEKKYLEREGAEVQKAIDRAESAGEADLSELMRRKQEISRKKSGLGRPRNWKGKDLGD